LVKLKEFTYKFTDVPFLTTAITSSPPLSVKPVTVTPPSDVFLKRHAVFVGELNPKKQLPLLDPKIPPRATNLLPIFLPTKKSVPEVDRSNSEDMSKQNASVELKASTGYPLYNTFFGELVDDVIVYDPVPRFGIDVIEVPFEVADKESTDEILKLAVFNDGTGPRVYSSNCPVPVIVIIPVLDILSLGSVVAISTNVFGFNPFDFVPPPTVIVLLLPLESTKGFVSVVFNNNLVFATLVNAVLGGVKFPEYNGVPIFNLKFDIYPGKLKV